MKTSSLLFVFLFIAIQNLVAQEQKSTASEATIITSLNEKSTSDYNDGFLKIKSEQNIDMVTFTDKQGKVVLKEIPQNNQIATHLLKPGFYLLCAYSNGVKIKKGMLKKCAREQLI